MQRRDIIKATGASLATVIGGVASTGSAAAYNGDTDCSGDEVPSDPDHPVVDAVEFGWHPTGGRTGYEGPIALLDMPCAGGRWAVVFNADEYAEMIHESHPVWEQYQTVGNIRRGIKIHMIDHDGVVGVTLWERNPGTPRIPPEDFYDNWDSEEFEDRDNYDLPE
jgi:hypothetical protein